MMQKLPNPIIDGSPRSNSRSPSRAQPTMQSIIANGPVQAKQPIILANPGG